MAKETVLRIVFLLTVGICILKTVAVDDKVRLFAFSFCPFVVHFLELSGQSFIALKDLWKNCLGALLLFGMKIWPFS